MATSIYIPNEILGHIFVLACDISSPITLDILDGTATATDARHTISLVCRRWRDVAFSLGLLWSNVLITDEGLQERSPMYSVSVDSEGHGDVTERTAPERIESIIAMLHYWFSRFGSEMPLTLRWRVSESTDQETQHACIRTLFAYTKRWRDVDMNLAFDPSSKTWPITWFDAFPQLQTLRISHKADNILFYPMMIELPHCPRLVSLSLIGVNLYNWDIPWSTLTHFTYSPLNGSDYPLSRLLHHISQAPNLTYLCIKNLWYSPDIASVGTTHLLTLTELSFCDIRPLCLVALLQNLICPHLRQLSIIHIFLEIPSPPRWTRNLDTTFLQFISHCSGSLEEIVLNVPTNAPDIGAFLSALPNLASLSCPGSPAYTLVIRQLLTLHFSNDGHLASGASPHLHSFTILGHPLPQRSINVPPLGDAIPPNQAYIYLWSCIVDMIISRLKLPLNAVDRQNRPIQPLQKVRLYTKEGSLRMWSNYPKEFVRIQRLKYEGYDISALGSL